MDRDVILDINNTMPINVIQYKSPQQNILHFKIAMKVYFSSVRRAICIQFLER
jgi:hypothetical protein